MAKSQCRHSMKRLRPTSPSPALENDDLLAEFLLRLPPQPSTLPRVGLVCKRWRRVVTDPRFVRRFRAFHRRTPPLHGFIMRSGLFFPTQAPPDRLPPSRFWRDRWCGEPDFQYRWGVHCCRHGLVLCCRLEDEFTSEFLVVDPMTGHRSRRVGVLHHDGAILMASTVVSVAGSADRRAFLVVALFAHDLETRMRLTASVYSSDSGAWADDSDAAVFSTAPAIRISQPSSLVGNAIYWFLDDGEEIVRFDLRTRRLLPVIEQWPRPPDVPPPDVQQVRVPWITLHCRSWILPSASAGDDDDGRFCLAVLCRRSIEFWEREAELSDDDAAKWVLCRTVQLDKVLPVDLVEENVQMLPLRIGISGFDEESNAIFLWTSDGIFMSHVESMQFKKVLEIKSIGGYLHPYSSV